MESAFAVFRREGMGNVNARSVARELHCSTQPIFSYYTGMGELKNVLEGKARLAFRERMAEPLSAENALLAVCKAYLRFAKEEPMLFRHLFIQTARGQEEIAADDVVPQQLREHVSSYYSLDAERAADLTRTACAYTHGIASVLATGVFRMDMDTACERVETLVGRIASALR